MSVYDSRKFSKIFSQRTEDNYKFIKDIVNNNVQLISKSVIEQYLKNNDEIKKIIENIKNNIKEEVPKIDNIQCVEKDKQVKRLGEIANNLEKIENLLDYNNYMLFSIDGNTTKKYELYEVTQLLNSLMGIIVLPYEMHNEYFKENCFKSLKNKRLSLEEIQNSVRDTPEYNELKEYIINLFEEGSWRSTYIDDVVDPKDKNTKIKEHKVVFSFLSHIRNATCHSGDTSIGLLPLLDGYVINEIIFYDRIKKGSYIPKAEFVMRISVDELENLISKIAKFYRDSNIGEINNTCTIKRIKQNAKRLLPPKGDNKQE